MSSDSERKTLQAVELTLVPGIGELFRKRLLGACPEMSGLFSMDIPGLTRIGIPFSSAEALVTRRYQSMSEEILDWCVKEGCRLLISGDAGYPTMLREIHDAPTVLYARGNISCLDASCLALVGTRRPTPYGLQMAEGLASDLAHRGMTIVSGLARGIDSAAHRGCLAANGPTVAVLGCGIDVVYPREHGHLTRRILEQGLLLSEFPPGTSPAPQNFPVRNRIISGLSLGVIIIEASEYSGSLITARLALEQNREVYAVPGNVTSPHSFGPNYLIKQGAKLVQSWRDIVEEFPAEKRREILGREARSGTRAQARLDLLSEEEKRILGLLQTDSATQFDRVLSASGGGVSQLSNMLLNLEMKGWIRQLPGSLYVRLIRPGE